MYETVTLFLIFPKRPRELYLFVLEMNFDAG